MYVGREREKNASVIFGSQGPLLTQWSLVVAKKRTLFDDRPVEIAELTYVIKQDLASLNSQISSLQTLQKSQQLQHSRGGAEQEGEHNKNVMNPFLCEI